MLNVGIVNPFIQFRITISEGNSSFECLSMCDKNLYNQLFVFAVDKCSRTCVQGLFQCC